MRQVPARCRNPQNAPTDGNLRGSNPINAVKGVVGPQQAAGSRSIGAGGVPVASGDRRRATIGQRAHQPPAHRRHAAHPRRRQGTGDTPHALTHTPLQLGICGRPRRPFAPRHTRTLCPHRSRLGARRGLVPDRGSRHGRPGLPGDRHPAPLLPRRGALQTLLNKEGDP